MKTCLYFCTTDSSQNKKKNMINATNDPQKEHDAPINKNGKALSRKTDKHQSDGIQQTQ